MKQEDERKRKLNEAIVNMLYPSPPSPQAVLEQQELQPAEALIEASGTMDHYENGWTSSEDEEEEHKFEREKLTRAQRKNIRKKKLKEEALRRSKLIGPLMPLPLTTTSDRVEEEYAPPVRSNASEEQGDDPTSGSSKKLKRRRMAKRLGASTTENCNQSSISSSAVDHKQTSKI